MIKKSVLATAMVLATASAYAGAGHWGYSGHEGPENWAKLSPDYSACTGKNQSPINLTGFIEADLKPIAFEYKKGAREVINNGHTVQVNFAKGSKIEVDGQEFELLQYHFHAPSENHIDGKSYPMEGHFVHADKDGNLAVVAVMFEEGARNSNLAKIWEHMPHKAGGKKSLSDDISASELLPGSRDYYRFNGSLTTPPCSEGVRWLVMKDAVAASSEQIEEFAHVMHHPNNRPLQAGNARPVLK